MNFIKYNPETKAVDLSTVYTSEQENSICIDGFNTSILKSTLQPSEVDDYEKPLYEGDIVDFVLGDGVFHDETGFYSMVFNKETSEDEKVYITHTSVETQTLEPFGWEHLSTFLIAAKLLWVDGEAKAQKLSGYEKKTVYVLEEDTSLLLPQAKTKKLADLSAESLSKAKALMPDYRKENVLFAVDGYTDAALKVNYSHTMTLFRNEYYRLSALVNACETVEVVNAITSNFPTEIVAPS